MAKIEARLTPEILEACENSNIRFNNKGDHFIIGAKSAPITKRKKKSWRKNQNLTKTATLRHRQPTTEKQLYKVNAEKRGWSGTALFAQRGNLIVKKSTFGIGSGKITKIYNGGGSPVNDLNYDSIADYKCLYVSNKSSDCQVIITQKHEDINDKLVRSGRRSNTWVQDEVLEYIGSAIEFGLSAKVLDEPEQNLAVEVSIEFWENGAIAPEVVSPKITIAGAQDWTEYRENTTAPPPNFDFYLFKIEISGKGTILFDNLEITHSGTNWAFDAHFDHFGSQPYGNFPDVEPDFRITHDPSKTDILIDYVENYAKI